MLYEMLVMALRIELGCSRTKEGSKGYRGSMDSAMWIRIVWMLHDEANSDVLLIGRVA